MWEFLRLLFAPCEEVSRQASCCLDHDLPRAQRLAIRFHQLYCSACRRYQKHIDWLREALREIADGTGPAPAQTAGLSPEARARIASHLRELGS